MRKLQVLFLAAILQACSLLSAQNLRYSAPFPSVSSATATPYLVANVPPNSPVLAVCHSPANQVPCTNYATTYTSAGAACSNGAQDTPDPQPSNCQSIGDAQGNIGFWAPPGQYDYTVCIQNSATCLGPYTVTLGAIGLPGATFYGSSFANLTAAVAACPNQGTILITSALVAATSVTVPSSCGLVFFAGGQLNIASGQTVTINGPLTAGPFQIFAGTGAVTGLTTVMPEWFGANTISPAVQSAFAASGGTLYLQQKAYTSGMGSTCWTQPNVTFLGAGEPAVNSGFTALTGGTIIQGSFGAAGANNLRFTNLGIDNGSAFNGGASTNDGLMITGATGCSTSNPSDPLVTGTVLENVVSLLSSGAVLYHAIRLEHNSGAFVKNVAAYFGTHGLTLKSTKSIVMGLHAYGQGGDCMIMKADGYTSTGNNIVSDVYCETLSSANVLLNGIILDSEGAAPLLNITLSAVQIINAQNGLVLTSNGTAGAGAISGVNVTGFTYTTNSTALGLTQHVCVAASGASGETGTWIHLTGIECLNAAGLNADPFIVSMPLNNSTIENVHTAGANSTGSTLLGNVTINNWNATDDTSSKPFAIGASSNVNIAGYQGATSLLASSVATGSTFNIDGHLGTNFGHSNTDAVYFGSKTMTVSSLSTATIIPNSSANFGMLVMRDNTNGGSAAFILDPNSGAFLVNSQIAGLAAASDITYASGQWHVALTSGSVPRTLAYTFYD